MGVSGIVGSGFGSSEHDVRALSNGEREKGR